MHAHVQLVMQLDIRLEITDDVDIYTMHNCLLPCGYYLGPMIPEKVTHNEAAKGT